MELRIEALKKSQRPMTGNYPCTYSTILSQTKHFLIFPGPKVLWALQLRKEQRQANMNLMCESWDQRPAQNSKELREGSSKM